MPLIFFLLSGIIDILGWSCIDSQDLILVKTTQTWLGASRNWIFRISAAGWQLCPIPWLHSPCSSKPQIPLCAPSAGSAVLFGATSELLAQQSCFGSG